MAGTSSKWRILSEGLVCCGNLLMQDWSRQSLEVRTGTVRFYFDFKMGIYTWKLTWHPKMAVWKINFLSKWWFLFVPCKIFWCARRNRSNHLLLTDQFWITNSLTIWNEQKHKQLLWFVRDTVDTQNPTNQLLLKSRYWHIIYRMWYTPKVYRGSWKWWSLKKTISKLPGADFQVPY